MTKKKPVKVSESKPIAPALVNVSDGTHQQTVNIVRRDYGSVIREGRRKMKIGAVELSNKLGYSNSACTSWEKNTTRPDIDAVVPLCNILGLKLGEFFGAEENEGNLLPDERAILYLYRQFSPELKVAFYEMVQVMARDRYNISPDEEKEEEPEEQKTFRRTHYGVTKRKR